MRLMEKEWESYRKKVVHPKAGEAQVRETKVAFYAGAYVFVQALYVVGHNPANPTQDALDEANLDALCKEVLAFFKKEASGE